MHLTCILPIADVIYYFAKIGHDAKYDFLGIIKMKNWMVGEVETLFVRLTSSPCLSINKNRRINQKDDNNK